MTLVTLEKVMRGFGPTQVLEECTLQIEEGDRLGLVGDNGCGKTTLLRIIAGRDHPDQGERRARRGLRVVLAEQIPTFPRACTVREAAMAGLDEVARLERELEEIHRALAERPRDRSLTASLGRVQERYQALGGHTLGHRVEEVLCGLGFRPADLDRPLATLSGGEKSRVQLAGVLLARADLLLLDEPTNHLDLAGIAFLEDLLRSGGIPFIVVSHDRVFLDRVAGAIVDLEAGRLSRYPGGYSQYARLRSQELERQMKEWRRRQELVAREEDFYRRYHSGQRSREAKGRLRRLRRLEVLRRPPSPGRKGPKLAWRGSDPGGGYEMLRVEELTLAVGEPGRVLLQEAEFRVGSGERVGIVGPNGAGKTTLLRVLAGLDPPAAGKVERYPGVETAWFDQEVEGLVPERTLLEEMQGAMGMQADQERIRSHLALFLFTGEEVEKRVGDLSGGEARRLLLARLTCRPAGMLFLDEPTNHLDIAARESLEEALIAFPGTLFFVSHDRFFLDRVATRILFLDPPRLSAYPGSWSEACRLKERRESARQPGQGRPPAAGREKRKPKGGRKVNRFKLERLEEEIFTLEESLEEAREAQGRPRVYQDRERSKALGQEIAELQERLDSLYREWEETGEA